jgi:hypothetical protein
MLGSNPSADPGVEMGGQSSALPLLSSPGGEGRSTGGVVADAMRSVEDAQSAVQMLTYDHPAARQGASPAGLVDLQAAIGPSSPCYRD